MANNKMGNVVPATYIKSPFDLVKAPVDWSIVETKLLIAIVSNIQSRFRNGKVIDEKGQVMLFSNEEFDEKGEVTLTINVRDLNINSKHYDQIETACKRLSSIIVPVIEKNKDGELAQFYRQVFTAGFSLDINNEQKYLEHLRRDSEGEDTGKTPWKRGIKNNKIYVKISETVAQNYFLDGNYSLHLRNIAHNCRCSYTPHLYMYLSKFRGFLNETTINYEELRKMVGMYKYNAKGERIRYDKEGNEVLDDKGMYPRFKDFEKRVLAPAKEELDRLAEESRVDLTFEYGLVYNGKERGNPDKIRFIVKAIDSKELSEVVSQMSAEERVACMVVDNEEEARWMVLAERMTAHDASWWNTYGTCCKSLGVTDGDLVVESPTRFVADEWVKQYETLLPLIRDIWQAGCKLKVGT